MIKRLLIICCLFTGIIAINRSAYAQEVSIPDPNLTSAVRNVLSLQQNAPITQQLMQKLTILSAQGAQISDLTGLEHATNLEILNLKSNQISDIRALADLTQLDLLSLASNQIKDISPLSALTNLSMLWLNENQISIVKSISGLTQLESLSLESNQIRIVTPLKDLLQLETLYLNSNQISSVRPLRELPNLEELYIADNPISDIFQIHQLIAAGVEVDFETSVPNESQVALTQVVFNEIRNASDDKNDWIELKNISNRNISLAEWDLSILTRQGTEVEPEVSVVQFPDYTLPAGQILLITNTHPRENTLLRGQNIGTPNIRDGARHQYLVAERLKIPNTQYMLILRSEQDKNDTQEAIEDVAGTYFFDKLTADQPLTQGTAWQRAAIQHVGYAVEAWRESGYQGGVGYQPKAPEATSLGTPGYPNSPLMRQKSTGQISISEVMFTNKIGNRDVPQWIELYNNSHTEAINLNGWKITIEARHGRQNHYIVLEFRNLNILPNQTVLLVSGILQASQNIPVNRVYNLSVHHLFELAFQFRSTNVLSPDGFFLQVLSPDGIIIDTFGNLDGDSETQDTPIWDLPSGTTENGARTSILRRYDRATRMPLIGRDESSWRLAVDAKLGKSTYWGDATDVGSPGYTLGGVLPVTLSSFRAKRTGVDVVIKWTTESEIENAGFNILRSESRNGAFKVVNPKLIQGAGTTGERNTYMWTDTAAKPNVAYYYRLEDVSFAGVREQLATVRTKGYVSAKEKLIHTWGNLKKQ